MPSGEGLQVEDTEGLVNEIIPQSNPILVKCGLFKVQEALRTTKINYTPPE